jgi:hypothetical protein
MTDPMPTPPDCWYRDLAHHPRLGWCPRTCQGLVTFAERLGNGDQHLYCDTHAHWRHRTIRLPTLVRRMPPTEGPSV